MTGILEEHLFNLTGRLYIDRTAMALSLRPTEPITNSDVGLCPIVCMDIVDALKCRIANFQTPNFVELIGD